MLPTPKYSSMPPPQKLPNTPTSSNSLSPLGTSRLVCHNDGWRVAKVMETTMRRWLGVASARFELTDNRALDWPHRRQI